MTSRDRALPRACRTRWTGLQDATAGRLQKLPRCCLRLKTALWNVETWKFKSHKWDKNIRGLTVHLSFIYGCWNNTSYNNLLHPVTWVWANANQPSTSYFTKCHHEIWCWRMSKLALACGGSMICTCLIPILFAKKDRTISWNFQMIYQKYQCLPPCHQQVKLNAWTRPITASSIYGRSNWKHGVKQYHNLSQVILGTIRKTQGWTCGCRYVLWQFVKAVCCWNRTWCVKAMACWMPLNDHRELLICSIPGDGPRRSKWIKKATWSRETLKQERKKLAKWLCSSLLNFKLC